MRTQEKFLNILTKNGKKETSEMILLKSVKELHKVSQKNTNNIFKIAFITISPLFKIYKHKIKRKKKKRNNLKFKEIPGYIKNSRSRTSQAMKYILMHSRIKSSTLLYQEILSCFENKEENLKMKLETQKKILSHKHLFRYYRWS